jgi:hypothetical protein
MTNFTNSTLLVEKLSSVASIKCLEKVKKTKRTISLSEKLDHRVRILAANKRISVGAIVEDALNFYFSQAQENTEI